jgi:shikimate kinase
MTAGPGTVVASVVLVGFMGAGKSTVGRVLAERCGAPFVDCDALIEAQAGPIDAIFAEEGEPAFRERERDVVTIALAQAAARPAVVALGGGAVTTLEVREALARAVQSRDIHVVWLRAAVDELWRRVGEGESGARPLARDAEAFRRLYEERESLYGQVATVVVSCDASRTLDEVVDDVLRVTGLRPGEAGGSGALRAGSGR